ncbi:MAG: PD-(D/E)XK motif protein [Thermoleophilia bacterium]
MPPIGERIMTLWTDLEAEMATSGISGRKYRRLDLYIENGIRIGCNGPDVKWELLIEVGHKKTDGKIKTPKWKGMSFETIVLDVPAPETLHYVLSSESIEHKDVFVTVCADLIDNLENIRDSASRTNVLDEWVYKWSNFFQRFGLGGLTPERQRGLFGEIWFLNELLDHGIECSDTLSAWKGWEPGTKDFEHEGYALEVKTTLTKEPRKVKISSELQLNDKGLLSLYLLILTMNQTGGGGETLVQIVERLRKRFSCHRGCKVSFEHAIHEAGYLDAHSSRYKSTFTIMTSELFRVEEGFPRITIIPAGTGDLGYSILVGACNSFSSPYDEYFQVLGGA